MKFDIKKMYHDTVAQLEKHQVEIEIALGVLAVIAFAPEDLETLAAKEAVKLMHEGRLASIKADIAAIKKVLADASEEIDDAETAAS